MPFVSQPTELIYSELLKQIAAGRSLPGACTGPPRGCCHLLRWNTKDRQYFLNDQQILRAAEDSATPLTVKDIRQEQAMAGLLGNLGLILIVVIGLSFLLKRSAQVANRALGFGRSRLGSNLRKIWRCVLRMSPASTTPSRNLRRS